MRPPAPGVVDPWVATVKRVAQSYDPPEVIELSLAAEGMSPTDAYLMVQAGLLYAAWQGRPLPPVPSTLPPPV